MIKWGTIILGALVWNFVSVTAICQTNTQEFLIQNIGYFIEKASLSTSKSIRIKFIKITPTDTAKNNAVYRHRIPSQPIKPSSFEYFKIIHNLDSITNKETDIHVKRGCSLRKKDTGYITYLPKYIEMEKVYNFYVVYIKNIGVEVMFESINDRISSIGYRFFIE